MGSVSVATNRPDISIGDGSAAKSVLDYLKSVYHLKHLQALAHWDLEVNMPSGAIEPRAEAISHLDSLIHQQITATQLSDALQALAEQPNKTVVEQAILREVQREVTLAKRLPAQWVEAFSKTVATAQSIWSRAREEHNFQTFAPTLKTLVSMCQEKAGFSSGTASPYDVLMDEFEPGLTTQQVDPLFHTLASVITPWVHAIAEQPKPDHSFMERTFSVDGQMAFSRTLLEAMHFDMGRGRLDKSVHPFTSEIGSSLDVRLTTRATETMPMECLLATMHEGGHGLYEQGIDPALPIPVRSSISLGIHESQSRLWENQVGRNRGFWQTYYPQMQQVFGNALANVSLEAFYRAINIVEPSLVRIEADEMTYNLHIIIRYNTEKALLEGKLDIQDIPEFWNNTTQKFLGITPPHDGLGCLQDIHWAHGAFGYFPTYTLGNLYSAQFFKAATEAIPNLQGTLDRQTLGELRQWLKQEIHQYGRIETADGLCKRVTGAPLTPDVFIDYLYQKFSQLYSLPQPSTR